MSKYTTLSAQAFEQKAKLAIARTPLRKEVSLKDIEVISDEVLKVSGKQITMTKPAFKSVCKAVGLPIGFDKTFTSTFGDKARQQLINKLKLAVQAKGSTSLSLVVNPNSKEIIGVQKDAGALTSNQTFIETSSRIIDKYGLDVIDFSVSGDGGLFINATSPKNSWGIKGLKDEDHYGGITFSNNVTDGFGVGSFLYRLVCANGMIGTTFNDTLYLDNTDGFSMEKFWNSLNSLAERGFRPAEFEDKLRLAMNTKASLFEMENTYNFLKCNSDVDAKELESWIPFQTTRAAFHNASIDTADLTMAQKKGAKTGTSVWDVVNGITHFATHDNGIKIDEYDRRRMQVHASNLLTKDFDMANIIPSPF